MTDHSNIAKVVAQPILDKISQDIAKAMNVVDVRARMEQQDAVPLHHYA